MIATLDDGGTDYILGDDDDGTVIIEDQPVTVSVSRNADGVENGTNPSFTFTRAGDLTEELVVSYTVSGTASSVSSADYTALSGSVTFDENEDTVVVTATLTNDSTSETTETISVLVDTDDDYLLANSSATVFITDDDTTSSEVYWVSTVSTDWSVASNWSINAVPGASHIVHFWSSKSNVDCTNLGYGLSTVEFAALRIENGYSGTITLDAPLTTGTFRLTSASATIDQPHDDEDINMSNSFYWTEGKLNTVDSGAYVTLDAASNGVIDPPDTGTVFTASTFRVVGRVAFLPGELEFTGGTGLEIAGIGDVISGNNHDVTVKGGFSVDKAIKVEDTGTLYIQRQSVLQQAKVVSKVPIETSGTVLIYAGITVEVSGHLGGGQGPSFKMNKGSLVQIVTSSTLANEFGMEISGGLLDVEVRSKQGVATLKGAVKFDGGTVNIASGGNQVNYGILDVEGVVTWNSGLYDPDIDGTDASKADLWRATKFNITNATLGFTFAAGSKDQATANRRWKVLEGTTGVKNSDNTANYPLPNITPIYPDFDMESNNAGDRLWWQLHRKPIVD